MLYQRRASPWCWDHPREYGENARAYLDGDTSLGSSPRIRGKWEGIPEQPPIDGIIPANTGKIRQHNIGAFLLRDHPREYGENFLIGSITSSHAGSSPRIRGELVWGPRRVVHYGIIPANTGRMNFEAFARLSIRDHPREYGENGLNPMQSLQNVGSSPRIRGECVHLSAELGPHRIIPANTGRM